jgi:bifunctional UDP-N-acetylglucosamine pyrophosphorylase / glucosamine-1-phosphate N-acetyltransferase
MYERMAVVLAAGKGTRMESELPKVLCPALGRPMIHFVLDVLDSVGVGRQLVVVGHRADLVREELKDRPHVGFVEQTEQLGTGHAVQVCRDALSEHAGPVLVVTGDSPLIQKQSVERLFEEFDRHHPACIMGTLEKEDPAGLGRIVRDAAGEFLGIVEEKDATPEQLEIREVNMSTYLFQCGALLRALGRLTTDNEQAEYYITDCPGILKAEGEDVRALPVLRPCEALSVNTVEDLAAVEAEMRRLGYECAN